MRHVSPAQPHRRTSFQSRQADPTQQLLEEIKDASPWLYESIRTQGLALDEDLPTIRY